MTGTKAIVINTANSPGKNQQGRSDLCTKGAMWRPELHRRWEYKVYREQCDACRQRLGEEIIA
jgi:hypothetical protein